jgi:hypothetical protein
LKIDLVFQRELRLVAEEVWHQSVLSSPVAVSITITTSINQNQTTRTFLLLDCSMYHEE